MDIFGRPNNIVEREIDSRVIVPNDFLRLDGTNQMGASINLGNKSIKNVASIESSGPIKIDELDLQNEDIKNIRSLQAPSGQSLEINSNIDAKNYNIQNIQGLGSVPGQNMAIRSPLDMYGSIDLRGYEVLNAAEPQSSNSLASNKTVDRVYWSLERFFEKDMSPIDSTGCTMTASSHHATWCQPEHAFDNKDGTTWIVSSTGRGKPGWVKIQFTSPKSLYKIGLLGRTGNAVLFQYIHKWTLEGSNNDVAYESIISKTENIQKTKKVTDFKICRPFLYYRISVEGIQSYGASIDLYEAVPVNKGYIEDLINNSLVTTPIYDTTGSSGFIPFVVNGGSSSRPTIMAPLRLQLDKNGTVTSITGTVTINSKLDVKNNQIVNVPIPINNNDAVNKLYVDNRASGFVHEDELRINNSMPNLPVRNGISIFIMPELIHCSITSLFQTHSVVDLVDKHRNWTADTLSSSPQYDYDNVKKLNSLSFDGIDDYLYADVGADVVAGPNGDETTLFFVYKNNLPGANRTQFSWYKKNPDGTYDKNVLVKAHLPWGNGHVIFDHGTGGSNRIDVNRNSVIGDLSNKFNIWTYSRNGSNAKYYENGIHIFSISGMSTTLNASDPGRFFIGSGQNDFFSKMNFYCLILYNRSLSDIEINKMNAYLRIRFDKF